MQNTKVPSRITILDLILAVLHDLERGRVNKDVCERIARDLSRVHAAAANARCDADTTLLAIFLAGCRAAKLGWSPALLPRPAKKTTRK